MGAALSGAARCEPAAQAPSCPYQPDKAAPGATEKPKGCPVDPSKWAEWTAKAPVGGEQINAANMMPAPNQCPAPGQAKLLGTDRVTSSIPQGATGGVGRWVYPSEQMFYNALLRKGKGDGVDEEAMPAVIAIHNNMNERGWSSVMQWEALRCDECDAEKISLLRFVGRPHDLSHKARSPHALAGCEFEFHKRAFPELHPSLAHLPLKLDGCTEHGIPGWSGTGLVFFLPPPFVFLT